MSFRCTLKPHVYTCICLTLDKPKWSVWFQYIIHACAYLSVTSSALRHVFKLLNACKHLHLTHAAPHILCVCVCMITQENICQTAAVSHPHLKHTCLFADAQAHKQPCKLHVKQAYTNTISTSSSSSIMTRPRWFNQAQTLLSNARQKISSDKDTSGSSPCQKHTDSGLFPRCCLDRTSQNKWEPWPKKLCIAKRWSV